MKSRKIGVILLAFLLAAMAMVPIVNGTEIVKNPTTAEVNAIQIPLLKADDYPEKTLITKELSPVTGKNVYTIPTGSIIQHSKTGVTRVFDSKGTQILVSDDNSSDMIDTPNGMLPATHVHEVPSGSFVTNRNNDTFVFSDGQLILTIIREYNPYLTSTVSSQTNVNSAGTVQPLVNKFNGWIEYAYDYTTTSLPLTSFDAYWNVPVNATSRSGTRTNFIFNGIKDYPTNSHGIIQPVLEWNNADTGYYWTIASWWAQGDTGVHSSRYPASVGQTIRGKMEWSSSQQCWFITTYNVNAVSSTSLTTTNMVSPSSSGLEVDLALEGWNIYGNADVPGDTLFQNVAYASNGQSVPIVLKRYTSGSAPLTGLNVEIISNPTTVRLNTAN